MHNLIVTHMTTFISYGTTSKLLNKWVYWRIKTNGKRMFTLCKQSKIVWISNTSYQHGQNRKYFLVWMTILI